MNRTFTEQAGPFLALGTTLFWALWGFEHDRERLDRNLDAIARGGFDYVRVLAAVGPEKWRDRTVDPTEGGWNDRIAAFTDWVYERHGLRVQWTVFGGVGRTPTPEDRREAVDRFSAALRGREPRVIAVEMANEGWQNGFADAAGQRELKTLAGRVRTVYPGLLATTAPRSMDCESQRAWYAGSPASLVTLHLPRNEPQWQAIDGAAAEGHLACKGLPHAYANNEPIGPHSSVKEDGDPLRLAAAAALSWTAGIGAYVLHTGAGIRGGGEEDRREGRPANVWETSNWGAITAALECVRFTLPADVPGWTRVREGARDHPFDLRGARTSIAHYPAAVRGTRFVTIPVHIRRPVTLAARRAMSVRAVHPLTCSTLAHRRLARGETLRLGTDPATAMIVGDFE